MRKGGDQGQATGSRLDLAPYRMPGIERGANHVSNRTLVAGRIPGIDGNQGRSQSHHLVDIYVGAHESSLTGSVLTPASDSDRRG